MDKELETRIRELLDKEAIRDRLMRYARGIDRNDGDLVEDTFWPEALVDHGHSAFRGEGIGKFFADVSKHSTVNQVHFIMNLVIDLHDNEAASEAQALYVAETERNHEPYLVNRAVRYIDRWEKREGVWKVFHRTVAENWNKIDPISERFPPHPGIIATRPDKSDVSYKIFEMAANHERPSLELPDNQANTDHAAHRLDAAGFRAPAPRS